MDKKTLGSFLSALRRAQGLTQQEVADHLAVSNRAVSRWERDEAMPDITLLPAIADLFGVTADELLRGERKRTAEPTEPAAENAESTSDASPVQPPRPEADPRALRGLRAMMNRALSRFRNLMILAIALAIAGLFIMMGVSYGFYRPMIGFILLLLFVLAGISVACIAALRMKDTLDEYASEESETRLSSAELAGACRTYAEWIFRASAVAIQALLLGLPLAVFRDRHLVDSVLSSESYIPMVLVITILFSLLTTLVHSAAIRLLCRPWNRACEGAWGDLTISPNTNPKKSLKLTLWQIIPAWAVSIGIQVANGMIQPPDSTDVDYFSIIAVTFFLIGVAITCVSFPLSLRGTKANPALRRELIVSGIRNLIVCAVGIFTISGGISYGWVKDSIVGSWVPYQYWNKDLIILGIIAILVIVLVSELIRRHLRNRKF